MRWLFRKSKGLHKVLGLLLIVYGALMGALADSPDSARGLAAFPHADGDRAYDWQDLKLLRRSSRSDE